MASPQARSPARQTSAQAPQADPPPSSPPEAAPRQAGKPAPHLDRAPPRPAASSHQADSGTPKENPFATQAKAERRKSALDSLRQARGQPAAKSASEAKDEGATPSDRDVRPDRDGHQPTGSPTTPPTEAKAEDGALAMLKKQMDDREAGVRAAEAKVREAHSAAEKRAAEAEAREAKAEAHLKRLEMLRGDPVQFLAEAGITEKEFKEYLASGGKPTGEQQRLSETEKQMAAMRAEMDKVRAETQQSLAQMRREREDQEFMGELSKADYTLVNTMGGLNAVRAKQASLRETLGKDVTLAEAAGQLEHEWDHGFKELLKNPAVRTKLGLDVASPAQSTPEPSRPTSPRTLNGSLSSTTSHKGEQLAWNDWRGKRERVLRELARARGN